MNVASHMPSIDPKKQLIREFANVGLKKDVLEVLPDWWGEALSHPSGMYEVRGFVAKHFGLEIGPDGHLRQRIMPLARFKTRTGTDITEIAAARAIATAVARVVAAVTLSERSWKGSLPGAERLRDTILGSGRPWIGLSDLISTCWESGIPIVYLPSLPVATPKMEGMVAICGGRPVILITKKMPHLAWMLFVLAHEMGHLALRHLDESEGGTILDEKVSEDEEGLTDPQEIDANAYALLLLTGSDKRAVYLSRLIRAEQLANDATAFGRSHKIDPGHLVLNAARNMEARGKNIWPLANSTLKYLNRDENCSDICRSFLRQNVDMDALSPDSFEFLERLAVL